MRSRTSLETDRKTIATRLGSMAAFTISGCLGAWAIVEPALARPLIAGTLLTAIAGVVLARRASRILYGR
jgi:ethanolamine transporter EutH